MHDYPAQARRYHSGCSDDRATDSLAAWTKVRVAAAEMVLAMRHANDHFGTVGDYTAEDVLEMASALVKPTDLEVAASIDLGAVAWLDAA